MLHYILALALLCTSLSAQPVPPDAATLELLNQGREDEELLRTEQVRLLKPKSFPEATAVGYLVGANDCMVGTILVEGLRCSLAEGSARVLRKYGWEKALPEERARLARLWVEEVLLGFGESMLQSRPDGFPAKTPFQAPEVVPMLSGAVRIIAWVQQSPGASLGRVYRRSLYWFGREGGLMQSRVLERAQGE